MREYTSRNDWLAHAQGHRYIKREWRNGQWVYTYPEDVNTTGNGVGKTVVGRTQRNQLQSKMTKGNENLKNVQYQAQKAAVEAAGNGKRTRHVTTINSGGNKTTYINGVKVSKDFEKREREEQKAERRERRDKRIRAIRKALPGVSKAITRVQVRRAKNEGEIRRAENQAVRDAKQRASNAERKGKVGSMTVNGSTAYVNADGKNYSSEEDIRKKARKDTKKAQRKRRRAEARAKVDKLFGK